MLNEEIRKVMAAVFGINTALITDGATPDSIEQWDSLRHMNLVLALEDEFGVRFPEDEIDGLVSFPAIEQSLRKLLE
jgi:acyl carrier protein